jgi:hypothetical protein
MEVAVAAIIAATAAAVGIAVPLCVYRLITFIRRPCKREARRAFGKARRAGEG